MTEMVTGLDLVKLQILVAAGEKLPLKEIPSGCGVTPLSAEFAPKTPKHFTPSAGKITGFHVPGGTGVRVDTAAYAESVIPPYYDSLIAKLVVHGKDREEAIQRMSRALEMFIIEGISTSIPLQEKILADPDFQAGNFEHSVSQPFFTERRGRLTCICLRSQDLWILEFPACMPSLTPPRRGDPAPVQVAETLLCGRRPADSISWQDGYLAPPV